MESPLSIDCSPREDYSRCVADYEDNSDKCSKKCGTFFQCDQRYKDLQLELYELLTKGDEIWETISTCTRGTSKQKVSIESLQDAVELMYGNLASQEAAIKDVDSSMRKAVKQLEKTSSNIEGLMEQVSAVRKNLAERIQHMAKLEPALARKRSPKESRKHQRAFSPKSSRKAAAGYPSSRAARGGA